MFAEAGSLQNEQAMSVALTLFAVIHNPNDPLAERTPLPRESEPQTDVQLQRWNEMEGLGLVIMQSILRSLKIKILINDNSRFLHYPVRDKINFKKTQVSKCHWFVNHMLIHKIATILQLDHVAGLQIQLKMAMA